MVEKSDQGVIRALPNCRYPRYCFLAFNVEHNDVIIATCEIINFRYSVEQNIGTPNFEKSVYLFKKIRVQTRLTYV